MRCNALSWAAHHSQKRTSRVGFQGERFDLLKISAMLYPPSVSSATAEPSVPEHDNWKRLEIKITEWRRPCGTAEFLLQNRLK